MKNKRECEYENERHYILKNPSMKLSFLIFVKLVIGVCVSPVLLPKRVARFILTTPPAKMSMQSQLYETGGIITILKSRLNLWKSY